VALISSLKLEDEQRNLYFDIFINHATPDLLLPRSNSDINIGYSVWETDRINKSAANKCNQLDMIFTASEYSKFAFLNGGVTTPIHVIPHVVTKKEHVSNDLIYSVLKDKKVFLSVFEWHIGKGYDVLIPGFLEAFKGNEDAVLVLKVNSFTSPHNLKSEVRNYIKQVKGSQEFPKIYPIIGPVDEDYLFTLYDRADFYINMSRREAFSLTTAEAAVRGKVIIAPDKGGHREFLDFDSAVLIPSEYVDVKTVERERFTYLGQKWIEPNYDAYVAYLKATFEEWANPDEEQKETLKNITNKIQEHLSSDNVIKMFRKYINI
jgi:glycosyltransferase involved in cell wall biosynthesis